MRPEPRSRCYMMVCEPICVPCVCALARVASPLNETGQNDRLPIKRQMRDPREEAERGFG
eukprot:scaffold3155_cov47-Phaeocystis_antarctica.AAC.2